MEVTVTFRIISNKTRIETHSILTGLCIIYCFQNNIQQNKDWNSFILSHSLSQISFQNNIQQNKDWNKFLAYYSDVDVTLSE